MILGLVLIGFTSVAVLHVLKAMCILTHQREDTRPLAMAFFLLLSSLVLEGVWVIAPEVVNNSNYFNIVWTGVYALLVACICWLIALITFPKPKKSKGTHI